MRLLFLFSRISGQPSTCYVKISCCTDRVYCSGTISFAICGSVLRRYNIITLYTRHVLAYCEDYIIIYYTDYARARKPALKFVVGKRTEKKINETL